MGPIAIMVAFFLAISAAVRSIFAAGEFSDAGADAALDFLTGRAAPWAAARNTFLSLCTTAPTDTALGTEVTTSGYARQDVDWTAPTGDPSSTSNSGLVTFGPFTADPPNITHCALMDAVSGGTASNMLMWWALDVAKDPAINESLQFAIGALVMTLD